jgi:hypothetical protein
MNLIDHRILIPTSPDRVWVFVGDLRRNPQWQVNVESVSFLTAADKPRPGTRLRVTPARGRDYVIEITAWYDRFGYEYHVVEGLGFRENRGQVRLQEVPEGTIVQWTFSYSGGGLFSRSGKQEQQIVDGLRGLYKLISRSKEVDTFQAKSLMRDDPGVEARAKYRPRHSSSPGDKPPTSTPLPEPVVNNALNISEPMILDEDTRPRTGQVAALNDSAVSPVVEPDFLIDEPNTPFTDIPSEPLSTPEPMATDIPQPPIEAALPAAAEPIDQKVQEPDVEKPASKPARSLEDTSPTGTASPPVVIAPQQTDAVAEAPKTDEPSVELPAFIAPPASVSSEVQPGSSERIQVIPPVTRDKLSDTAKISVFDLFGLPKPSETQEIVALTPEEVAAAQEAEAVLVAALVTPEMMPNVDKPPTPKLREYRRFGYRTVARNRRLKLRRPY